MPKNEQSDAVGGLGERARVPVPITAYYATGALLALILLGLAAGLIFAQGTTVRTRVLIGVGMALDVVASAALLLAYETRRRLTFTLHQGALDRSSFFWTLDELERADPEAAQLAAIELGRYQEALANIGAYSKAAEVADLKRTIQQWLPTDSDSGSGEAEP